MEGATLVGVFRDGGFLVGGVAWGECFGEAWADDEGGGGGEAGGVADVVEVPVGPDDGVDAGCRDGVLGEDVVDVVGDF